MYQLQVFLKKNHNMGHTVMTRNAISFLQKFLKPFQKYLLDSEKSSSNTCFTTTTCLVCFYMNPTTWLICNQILTWQTRARFFIIKTYYKKKGLLLQGHHLNKFLFKIIHIYLFQTLSDLQHIQYPGNTYNSQIFDSKRNILVHLD